MSKFNNDNDSFQVKLHMSSLKTLSLNLLASCYGMLVQVYVIINMSHTFL